MISWLAVYNLARTFGKVLEGHLSKKGTSGAHHQLPPVRSHVPLWTPKVLGYLFSAIVETKALGMVMASEESWREPPTYLQPKR